MSPISSCVHISADLTNPHFGHAWRDKDGDTFATVRFGGSDLAFTSAEDARAVARACTEAAAALDKLAAEHAEEPS